MKPLYFGLILFTILLAGLFAVNYFQIEHKPSCTYPNGLMPQYTKFMFDNNNKLNDLQKAQISFGVGYEYANCNQYTSPIGPTQESPYQLNSGLNK